VPLGYSSALFKVAWLFSYSLDLEGSEEFRMLYILLVLLVVLAVFIVMVVHDSKARMAHLKSLFAPNKIVDAPNALLGGVQKWLGSGVSSNELMLAYCGKEGLDAFLVPGGIVTPSVVVVPDYRIFKKIATNEIEKVRKSRGL
jgi:hypothetical protein